MKSYFFLLLVGALILACGDSGPEVTGNPDSGDPDSSTSIFSGVWVGDISGGRPHFKGDPTLSFNLTQNDTAITGTIETSDSAFVAAPIESGVADDSSLSFLVIQTNIYPGAEVEFTGTLKGRTINGEWMHAAGHNGVWSVTK